MIRVGRKGTDREGLFVRAAIPAGRSPGPAGHIGR
jgi:hypothetical protein